MQNFYWPEQVQRKKFQNFQWKFKTLLFMQIFDWPEQVQRKKFQNFQWKFKTLLYRICTFLIGPNKCNGKCSRTSSGNIYCLVSPVVPVPYQRPRTRHPRKNQSNCTRQRPRTSSSRNQGHLSVVRFRVELTVTIHYFELQPAIMTMGAVCRERLTNWVRQGN
jgi:hypothetical protein